MRVRDDDVVYEDYEVDKMPVITYRAEAAYTDLARINQISGVVKLKAIFNSSGKITQVLVLEGLSAGLNEQAIDAARKMEFRPALKNGREVSCWARIDYYFNLY